MGGTPPIDPNSEKQKGQAVDRFFVDEECLSRFSVSSRVAVFLKFDELPSLTVPEYDPAQPGGPRQLHRRFHCRRARRHGRSGDLTNPGADHRRDLRASSEESLPPD